MKILKCALVSTAWVAVLLAVASPVQAHYLARSASASDVHDAGVIHPDDNASPPQDKPHVYGPPQWPRSRDFLGSGMSALHTDGSAGVVTAGQPGTPPPLPNDPSQETVRDHKPRLRKAKKHVKL